MSNQSSRYGRVAAAVLAMGAMIVVFTNLLIDNRPKGEVRTVANYTPWDAETLRIAEEIPVQNGGRVKPLASYAGFTMLGLHGARSMKIEDGDGKSHKILPTAWMMDSLFRPQLAIKLPTFRVDNSAVLEAIGLEPRGKRDRYSYADIEPARGKLVEAAKAYEAIDKDDRDPLQSQTIDLAYNLRNYESFLGYFGFARFGVVMHGSGKEGAPDQHADVSAVMMTAPQIREQIQLATAQGRPVDTHLQQLLEQVFDGANFAKYGLFMLPPADKDERIWLSAGNAIANALGDQENQSQLLIDDIRSLEKTARSVGDEKLFRTELVALRDGLAKRAEARGEYRHVPLEADYYRKNWFLCALAFFIIGSISALGMWGLGHGKVGRVFSWVTLGTTSVGLIYCLIPMVKRSVIMQRPPVGNLYDTIIFIGTSVVLIALISEWMTRRRFALGIAPILGTLLILLARRYEVGDAKDNMDPLVAVLDSNYWLVTHVITITLGYSAGILAAFLAFGYLLMRGLGLDNGDREIRRSLSRAVYGMICLTLFLSLVGTVLGGVWANDSWGRFWGWDPKENGALLIVLWTLSILHARLGGYIKEWGLHLAAVFTAAVVTFSWWHVNFLGVGLHNYGFTAGKNTIWQFYGVILAILIFGFISMMVERSQKLARNAKLVPELS
ncbi:MAG: cytochrome c biogenesis protein CcsA [Akkermansiaceae bacterium]